MELAIESHYPLGAVSFDPLHEHYKQSPGYCNDVSNVGQGTQSLFLFSLHTLTI